MTRTILTLLTALAVSALLTVPAMAQATAPVAPKAGTTGVQATAAKDQIEYLKEVQDLHSRIRAAQWDLWSLQQQNADQKKVAAKTKELTRLRTRLHELKVANRPALGVGARWGFGAGPRGFGDGSGAPAGLRWQHRWGGGAGVGMMHRWGGSRGQGPGFGQYGQGPGFGQRGQGAGFRHRAGRGGGQGGRGYWGGGWGRGAGGYCPYQTF